MKAAELYDFDFAEWSRVNAELLRAGRFGEIDLEHVAEEIEDLGTNKRSALYNRFVRLIEHLLKWQFQPERRGTSWKRTMAEQRRRIRKLLDQNPSFLPTLGEVTQDAYRDAARLASITTGVALGDFPQTSPFSIEQLLDYEFLP
jgi:hypothetical protein